MVASKNFERLRPMADDETTEPTPELPARVTRHVGWASRLRKWPMSPKRSRLSRLPSPPSESEAGEGLATLRLAKGLPIPTDFR